MYTKSNSTFAEIKTSLNKVYDRIRIPQTKEKGQELFKIIISKNISNKTILCSIISNIQEKLSKLACLEKPPYLSLLSLFFYNQSQSESLKLYYPYLSPILSILQSLIIDSNSEIFSQISDTFAEIVQYLMPNDISASDKDLDPEEKESYETLQSFCILNIKIEQKLNRVIGSLCLTKLVENCPFVLKSQYMKYILENIIENVSKENFNAKYELLNCLISLILGAESLFCPFANMTLYKILDFLTDKDWLKRKLALNVIYTMIFYCKEEILPLKEHIINFLNVLKNDKIKEVRDVSILILQMFDDNKSIQTISSGVNISNSGIELKENENKKRSNNNINNYKRVRVVKKSSNTNNYKKTKKVSNNKIISTSPSKIPNKNRKNNLVTNLSKRNNNINNKNNNRDIKTSSRILKKENTSDRKVKQLSLNKRNNSFGKRKPLEVKKNSSISNTINKDKERGRDRGKENDRGGVRGESSKRTYRSRERRESSSRKFGIRRKTPMTRSVNISKEGSIRSDFGLRYPKYVNRKKDFSFVNQKMVIKPDPSKSIFNSNMNMAFFNQDKNLNGDVIVIPNENRNNYNTYNNFYKSKFDKDENEEKNENEKESRKEKRSNIRERIDKDFDNNLNNINELITLDAKIKTDNVKHIDNSMHEENSVNKKEEINNDISVDNHIDENKENNNINNISNDEIINKSNINNTNVNNDKNNTNLINLLLTEVRALSNKQITLLDLMDEIQTNSQEQIENLNQKIVDLNSTVKDLNHQLYILQRDQS